jgi:prepilin-type N-terminal cleavage/methylation domain-containing protein
MQKGFSLIEVILAVSVFGLIITGLIGALVYGQESSSLAGARVRAVFLAEEGLEAARNIRDADFNSLSDGNHGLVIAANEWFFSGAQDTTDIFDRQIRISTVNDDTKQVVSRVTWQQNPQRDGLVELVTYLANWQKVAGPVVSDCLTFCQSINYSNGICRPNQKQCSKNGETYEPNGDQYCVSGPQADTCCCQ